MRKQWPTNIYLYYCIEAKQLGNYDDIALLKLKKPLDLDNESLGRLCLPAMDMTLQKGDRVGYLILFGKISIWLPFFRF